MTLQETIVNIATNEIGQREVGNSNCGIRVNAYKSATTLDPTKNWPWCAAFVCWVIRCAFARCAIKGGARYKNPTTARAWGLITWSLAQDKTTHTRMFPGLDVQPGDIVVFTFRHCGIAVEYPDAGAMTVATVEGNTSIDNDHDGGSVMKRIRPLSKIKARIRFCV